MAVPKGHMQRNALGRMIGARGLTDQQAKFVSRYLNNGGDADEAAAHAAYAFPKQVAWQLMRNDTVRIAIRAGVSGELEACLLMSTTLLRRWLANTLADPEACVDPDSLRKIIGTLAARVLPTPKPLEENEKSLDDASIDDLETALASLKRQRSDAALVIAGEAQVIEPQGE